MAPSKLSKRSHSQTREGDDDDVSNKEILMVISDLTKKMSDFENRIVLMVNEQVAGVEKNVWSKLMFAKKVQRIV